MAATWYENELKNKNFLAPIGFKFVLEKAPKVAFLCQSASIPDITVGDIDIPTRGLVAYPIDGNIRYGEFNLSFLVDENLENYLQIHNWMRALGTPQEFKERRVWLDKYADEPSEDPRFSDATLQVLNNNNIANFDVVFKDMFPVSLSSLPFDVTGGDNDYFTSTATFRYTLYEIRNTNSQTRR